MLYSQQPTNGYIEPRDEEDHTNAGLTEFHKHTSDRKWMLFHNFPLSKFCHLTKFQAVYTNLSSSILSADWLSG